MKRFIKSTFFSSIEFLSTENQLFTYFSLKLSSMAFSIFQNTKNDRQFKAATGLDNEQFDKLFILFEPHYIPKSSESILYGNLPVLTDKREALFFILHYFKAYPTLQNMGTYFGMSDYAASTYLERIKPGLKAALEAQSGEERAIFKDQESFEKHFSDVQDIVIDVTEIPIERAVNQKVQERRFSGKKKSTR